MKITVSTNHKVEAVNNNLWPTDTKCSDATQNQQVLLKMDP